MNNLSLSTSWNSWRHKDGREMVGEILDLGFRRIELSHGIHSPLLEGVLKAREKHDFAISSVHNFLPMPVEVLSDSPDCYEFTSHRPHDRERAVALTRQTIDWAARLGAPVVVVHCGLIRSLNLTAPLRDIVGEGGIFGRPFVRKKLAAVQRREPTTPEPRESSSASKTGRITKRCPANGNWRTFFGVWIPPTPATGTISATRRSSTISAFWITRNGCARPLHWPSAVISTM